VEAFLPDLSAAFEVFNLSAEFYATQWFLTLFSYSMPFLHTVRIWDHFLCRGMKFIHRVGLALLSEARPTLLGQSFDCTVQRLRNIGQSTTLSPEALVAAAMEFKVTNRLLSELEHAMATGEGTALPVCIPERDLDSGRTRWRLHKASEPTTGNSVAASVSDNSVVFLEDALPAPRIPADPLAPCVRMGPDLSGAQDAAEPCQVRQHSAHRRPALRRLPKAVLHRIKNSRTSGHSASKEEAPSGSSQREPSCGASGGDAKVGKGQPGTRSSSMPALRLQRRKTSQSARRDAVAERSVPDGSLEYAGPKGLPQHLMQYAVKDLDTGEWVLLGSKQAQELPAARASTPPPHRHKSWASKQVSKLRAGRPRHYRHADDASSATNNSL